VLPPGCPARPRCASPSLPRALYPIRFAVKLLTLPSTVYADWCGPCHAIAPVYEQLSEQLSRPNLVTFTKVDTEAQKSIATAYQISALPTFIVFRNGKAVERVQGNDPKRLASVVQKLNAEVESAGAAGEASGSGGADAWHGAELPRGYKNVTDQIEMARCELLNVDPDGGGVRVLFANDKPGNGKKTEKDWVESDTDEQLMLFVPFQSMIKLHTLQVRPLQDSAPRPVPR